MNLPKTAPRGRTELHCRRTAAYVAAGYLHVVVAQVGTVALQTDTVVGSVHPAVADAHVATVGHVDAVVIPVGTVLLVEMAQCQPFAAFKGAAKRAFGGI